MDEPRLIDANRLKKELLHAIWLPEWEHIRDKLLEDIDLQPTAYDINNVVEQLKANYKEMYGCYAIERTGYYKGKMDGYDHAIQIMERGGCNE